MRILARYLTKRLMGLFIMVALILAGLSWMTQILALMRYIVQYGADISQFLGMTMLMFPLIISIILPFVTFIAVLFIYNQMISDQEIPVMMSVGLSPVQIAAPALRMVFVITALHYLLTLFIVPDSQGRFYDKQWDLRYGLANLKVQDSTWTQLSQGLVAFVESANGQVMNNLVISDNREKQDIIIMADSGQMIKTAQGLTLATKSGVFQAKSDNMVAGTFGAYDMDMNLDDAKERGLKIKRVPTWQLISMGADEMTERQRSGWVSEIGNRFLAPLMNVLLALIALVCLLRTSILRRAASVGIPLAIGGMVLAQSAFMGMINASGEVLWVIVASAVILSAIFALAGALLRGGK